MLDGMTRRNFMAAAAAAPVAAQQTTDPVTGRKVTWFRSAHHETHHYYDITPWNPQGDRILFFRFDAGVDKLVATGRYPGSLWTMKADGCNASRQMASRIYRQCASWVIYGCRMEKAPPVAVR